MRELVLDGRGWQTRDQVYDAFFAAVGAPVWHGRNFNALRDSIATGSINDVEVPYCVVISNFDLISGEALQMATDFADLLRELTASGCPVEIQLRDSHGIVRSPDPARSPDHPIS
jgi:RNAse (barnase) inhibitor barstar